MGKQHAARFLEVVNAARTRIRECTVHDVHLRRQNGEEFHLVDVREYEEWTRGRIPGSQHIGKGVIERDIEARIPDTSAEIILYCGGGYRSALAAESLQRMGYENVVSMDGGFREWFEAGFLIET